jgi:hypothetical protein
MAATKFTVRHILTVNLLPGASGGGGDPSARGVAEPFTVYVCKDTGDVWIADAEGRLLSLSDMLVLGRGLHASLRADIDELKLTMKAIIDMNTKASDYIAWLRERASKRRTQ